MANDIESRSVFLPIEMWLANAALVHEEFQTEGQDVTHPRIQNLTGIMTHGFALGEFLDDETHTFAEPKEQIEIPVLTSTGGKIRDVKMLSGAETVQIPINAFNYALYAIMHGLDPDSSIIDNADVRFGVPGYTPNGPAEPSDVFDKVATMLDRQETIDTVKFCLLAHVQPSDPNAGDKYILCPKLVIEMETIQQLIRKEHYQQTVAMKAVILNNDELARWQNIMPSIKKTIGMYSFHVDSVET